MGEENDGTNSFHEILNKYFYKFTDVSKAYKNNRKSHEFHSYHICMLLSPIFVTVLCFFFLHNNRFRES